MHRTLAQGAGDGGPKALDRRSDQQPKRLNGNTATLVAGQACSGTRNGVTFAATYSTGTLTLTSPAALSASGAGSGTANGGTCTFSNALTATLVSHWKQLQSR